MVQNGTFLGTERDGKHYCIVCDYSTIHQGHIKRHFKTKKHINNEMVQNGTLKKKGIGDYICECGKSYKYSQGYSRHKNVCKYKKIENTGLNDMIFKLVAENKELRNVITKQSEQMIKQSDQISDLIPRIGNNNNNKHFNLNLFLNEKCKDAITINEFIQDISITLKELDFTKENGNIKGISNIITNNLKKLSLYKRPLHCYNKNDKVLYIKNNGWEEDQNYKQINSIITSIESRQIKELAQWTEENPEYMSSETKSNDFIKLVNKTMSNEQNSKKAIIKILCDKVMIKTNDN
jgi:hypothetical protein